MLRIREGVRDKAGYLSRLSYCDVGTASDRDKGHPSVERPWPLAGLKESRSQGLKIAAVGRGQANCSTGLASGAALYLFALSGACKTKDNLLNKPLPLAAWGI